MHALAGDATLVWQMSRRRTKIMATLGPATDGPGVLAEMISAGLDAVRINCSHGQRSDWLMRTRMANSAAAAAGRQIAVLYDLQGPKIRLAGECAAQDLAVRDEVTIGPVGTPCDIPVVWDDITQAAAVGRSELILGDGAPRLAITARDGDILRGVCVTPGEVRTRRGAFMTHAERHMDPLTAKDLKDIPVALEAGADFIALSFVHDADDIHQLRALLGERGGDHVRIVAKIETLAAIDALDEIVAAADGVMVARGDLGIEAGVPRVPLLQKQIIRAATARGKLAITATQMLESMTQSPEPTRAEATDVANAVLDGTSAVMLSGETATGSYPVDAVNKMSQIATEAQEGVPFSLDLLHAGKESVAGSVMQAAVLLGREIKAGALVIPTTTGGSVRAAAKYRPRRPILALCHTETVARQLALEWGVVPEILGSDPKDTQDLVQQSLRRARDVLGLAEDTPVVLTSGPQVAEPGATNLIAVHRISRDD